MHGVAVKQHMHCEMHNCFGNLHCCRAEVARRTGGGVEEKWQWHGRCTTQGEAWFFAEYGVHSDKGMLSCSPIKRPLASLANIKVMFACNLVGTYPILLRFLHADEVLMLAADKARPARKFSSRSAMSSHTTGMSTSEVSSDLAKVTPSPQYSS